MSAYELEPTRNQSAYTTSTKSTALLDLPAEIVLEIIRTIGVEDIGNDLKAVTRLAMASKQVLVMVEAAVGPLAELRSLDNRFSESCPRADGSRWIPAMGEDLKEIFPILKSEGVLADLVDLNLNGDYSWLSPRDTRTESEVYCGRYIATTDTQTLEEFIAHAESLNLTLPSQFISEMGSTSVLDHISFPCVVPFHVDPYLVRCPASLDHNAGGYLAGFRADVYEGWIESLYLDTMGQHEVLRVSFKWQSE